MAFTLNLSSLYPLKKQYNVIKSNKLHKIIGLILVLPMLGWTCTGMIFFIKPGYQAAYESLEVKTYPISDSLTIKPKSDWQKISLVKTILGEHLLVKTADKPLHLAPKSLVDKALPSEQEFTALLSDAFNGSSRYGDIVSINGLSARTSTGIEVKLDWQSLRLSQKGQDTALINLLYKIHYLQWTGHKAIDQVLGILGLILLITLTVLGVRLYAKKR